MNREERVEALMAAYGNWKKACERLLQAKAEYDIAKTACKELRSMCATYQIE